MVIHYVRLNILCPAGPRGATLRVRSDPRRRHRPQPRRLPALLEDLVARTGDRAVAADVAAEAVAADLAADDPAARLAPRPTTCSPARSDAVRSRIAARRRMGMPPLDLSDEALAALPAPPEQRRAGRGRCCSPPAGRESDDLLGDLEAQVPRRAAPRRPPARRRCSRRPRSSSRCRGARRPGRRQWRWRPGRPVPAGRARSASRARLARRVPVLDAARMIPLPAARRAPCSPSAAGPSTTCRRARRSAVDIEGECASAVPVVSHGDALHARGRRLRDRGRPGRRRGDAHCAWGDPCRRTASARAAGPRDGRPRLRRPRDAPRDPRPPRRGVDGGPGERRRGRRWCRCTRRGRQPDPGVPARQIACRGLPSSTRPAATRPPSPGPWRLARLGLSDLAARDPRRPGVRTARGPLARRAAPTARAPRDLRAGWARPRSDAWPTTATAARR